MGWTEKSAKQRARCQIDPACAVSALNYTVNLLGVGAVADPGPKRALRSFAAFAVQELRLVGKTQIRRGVEGSRVTW
jgi:hypothetical protein